MKKEYLDELEELAKKFIIDYVPLSDEQSAMFDTIRELESRYRKLEAERSRIKRLLEELYKELTK